MKKTTGFYPRLRVDAKGGSAVGQAGGVLLTSAVRAAGLDAALSTALAPWRASSAVHDPAKVLVDLALTLALGGDTRSDLAVVRAEPAVFGRVASDPALVPAPHLVGVRPAGAGRSRTSGPARPR